MARLLEVIKHIEKEQLSPAERADLIRSDPVAPSRAIPAVSSFAASPIEDEPVMPFIEVGPSRSVEGSPDVLAHSPRAATVQTAPISTGLRAVTFRPLAAPARLPAGIATEIIAYHQPAHPVSVQYREILTAILAAAPNVAAPTLLFTASTASAGTTSVVLNLAVTAVRQGRRVVVVDVNTRRPAVAARLALCDRPGLNEVLAETVTLEAALQETKQPGLVALTNSGLMMGTPRTPESYRSLLRQLRYRFDLILLDSPRWNNQLEVVAPGIACDAAFLVLPAEVAGAVETEELSRQFLEQGLRLAGSIIAAR